MKIFALLVLSAVHLAANAPLRTLPLYAEGWAGSSVNMLANQSSTLITDGNFQYPAFYATTPSRPDAAGFQPRSLGNQQNRIPR